jgi:hypothetical protein
MPSPEPSVPPERRAAAFERLAARPGAGPARADVEEPPELALLGGLLGLGWFTLIVALTGLVESHWARQLVSGPERAELRRSLGVESVAAAHPGAFLAVPFVLRLAVVGALLAFGASSR